MKVLKALILNVCCNTLTFMMDGLGLPCMYQLGLAPNLQCAQLLQLDRVNLPHFTWPNCNRDTIASLLHSALIDIAFSYKRGLNMEHKPQIKFKNPQGFGMQSNLLFCNFVVAYTYQTFWRHFKI